MASTITDIAKLAGVSHSSVSRVLNGAPIRISKQTRQRILNAAEQLNYVPNLSAKALKKGRHGTIAVLAYDITDAFAVECVSAMEQIIENTPYRVMWSSCKRSDQAKLNPLTLLKDLAQSSDGIIIIAATRYLRDHDILKFWANTQIPIVTIIRSIPGDVISSVTINEELGAAALMEHLFSLGHKKIAFCHANPDNASAQRRYNVYLDMMKSNKLTIDKKMQAEVDGSPADGFRCGSNLFVLDNRPTAIIGYNDLTGIGLLKAVYDKGLNVPANVSIASFDNIRISAMTTPALTTVGTNFHDLVRHAFDEVVNKIDKSTSLENFKAKHYVVEPNLLIRESTGKTPRK
jgi:LacI family transcriptional regulator